MSERPPTRSFTVTPTVGELLELHLPFDPREAFGRARAPVVVRINGYAYRSTVMTMRGETFVPLRRSHREAAGVVEGAPLDVTLTLDTEPRTVEVPDDLQAALESGGGMGNVAEAQLHPPARGRRVGGNREEAGDAGAAGRKVRGRPQRIRSGNLRQAGDEQERQAFRPQRYKLGAHHGL